MIQHHDHPPPSRDSSMRHHFDQPTTTTQYIDSECFLGESVVFLSLILRRIQPCRLGVDESVYHLKTYQVREYTHTKLQCHTSFGALYYSKWEIQSNLESIPIIHQSLYTEYFIERHCVLSTTDGALSVQFTKVHVIVKFIYQGKEKQNSRPATAV